MIKDFDEFKRLLIDFMIINNNEHNAQLDKNQREEQMKEWIYTQKELNFDRACDKKEIYEILH